MTIFDVDVLLRVFHPTLSDHPVAHEWMDSALQSREEIGLLDTVLVSFFRIATNRGLFESEGDLGLQAQEFLNRLMAQPSVVRVQVTAATWEEFWGLRAEYRIEGKHVPDAFLAALAIENRAEFVTFDRGFTKFRQLRIRLLGAGPPTA